MDHLVVLADDFTGACDAAGGFATARGTRVLLSVPGVWPMSVPGVWPSRTDAARTVEVVSVDLDLRERSDDEARQVTAAAAQAIGRTEPGARPAVRLFVKIDSTLRGPIAGLVDGALAGSGTTLAVVAPAFPEQGRLLSAGRLVLDGRRGANDSQAQSASETQSRHASESPGRPASEGPIGSDGQIGSEGARLGLAHRLGRLDTVVLSADVAHAAASLETAIESARRQGARHVVVDTDAPVCLATLASIWSGHPDWLLVGSGGLARHLAGSASRLAPGVRAAAGPILIVAGSPSPMTRSQLDCLRPRAPLTVVETAAARPPSPPPHTGLLVLCTPPARERDSGENARAVADTVVAWSKQLRPGALILAGGATARLVCAGLGAAGVDLLGELQPGVPIGRLADGKWDGVIVVTKAGGFGTPTTLLDAVQALVA